MKVVRVDLIGNENTRDTLLATKVQIILTIITQSYDAEKELYYPFFLLKASVKKFIALELMSCIKLLFKTQKNMENSFYFKISYFFGIQQYHDDIEHEINIILKKSYNHISIGMGLSKISSRIEATGFKKFRIFAKRISIRCLDSCWNTA